MFNINTVAWSQQTMLHLKELWQHSQSLGFGVHWRHHYQLNINIQCIFIKDANSLSEWQHFSGFSFRFWTESYYVRNFRLLSSWLNFNILEFSGYWYQYSISLKVCDYVKNMRFFRVGNCKSCCTAISCGNIFQVSDFEFRFHFFFLQTFIY